MVEAAREITTAEYAALGVLNPDRTELERFIYRGIDDETKREIGSLPRGRGVLGELIREPVPLRLRDADQHDCTGATATGDLLRRRYAVVRPKRNPTQGAECQDRGAGCELCPSIVHESLLLKSVDSCCLMEGNGPSECQEKVKSQRRFSV